MPQLETVEGGKVAQMERDRGSRGSQGEGKRKETWMPATVTQAGVAPGRAGKGAQPGDQGGMGGG